MSEAEFEAKIAELRRTRNGWMSRLPTNQLRLAQQDCPGGKLVSGQKERIPPGALEGYNQSDLTLMAAIIQAEADNQS